MADSGIITGIEELVASLQWDLEITRGVFTKEDYIFIVNTGGRNFLLQIAAMRRKMRVMV